MSRKSLGFLISLVALGASTTSAQGLSEVRDRVHGQISGHTGDVGAATVAAGTRSDGWETAAGVDLASSGQGQQVSLHLPKGMRLFVSQREAEWVFGPGEDLQVRLHEVERAFTDGLRAGLLTPSQIPPPPDIPGGLGAEGTEVGVAVPVGDSGFTLLGGLGKNREYLIVGHGQPGAGQEGPSWESEYALLGVGFEAEDKGFWFRLGLDLEPVDEEITAAILEASPAALEIPERLRQFAAAGWFRLGAEKRTEVGGGLELRTFGGVGAGAQIDLYATHEFDRVEAGVSAHMAEGPGSRRQLSFEGTFLRPIGGAVWTASFDVVQYATETTVPPELQVVQGIEGIQEEPSFSILGVLANPANAALEPEARTTSDVFVQPGVRALVPAWKAEFAARPAIGLDGRFRGFEVEFAREFASGLGVRGGFGEVDGFRAASAALRVPGSAFRRIVGGGAE